MKHTHPNGRFSINLERRSILSGITADLEHPVGQNVEWWRFDPTASESDDIYDVGSIEGGRRWKNGFRMPAIRATIFHGVTMQNERGFYNTDVLRLTVNMKDVERLLPGVPMTPDEFLRDRIVYRGQVFTPTRLYPRGLLIDGYTVFTLDANQVNSEELVNDQQFAQYAS